MTWALSRFRAGDLVQVRDREEILSTLDQHGCVEGLPFMPEMLQFCGQPFRVRAVAHKTCETAHKTYKGRRLRATVHLANLRCDGCAHGGCQAACTLFWKDVWLKPAGATSAEQASKPGNRALLCTEERLNASTRRPETAGADEPRYACQATKLYDATEPLAWWDLRQYVFDVSTGNHAIARVLRVTWLRSLRWLVHHTPFGYRLCSAFSEWMHRLLTGRGSPTLCGKVTSGSKTPTGRLHLQPGDLVRIKSQNEIEGTLDARGNNRGLSFDPEEMAPYCGGVFRVRSSVTKILDEVTGAMLNMKQPCIILEGVVCNSEYAQCRLNCPRAIPCFWRELWLERVHDIEHDAADVPGRVSVGRQEVAG